MNELEKTVNILLKAVFGDPERPKEQPGIVKDMMSLETKLDETNKLLAGVRADLKKGVWIVLAAVITAILAFVLKH